ncbi:MAG: polysaccharide deacetylase family protein [Candidatus Acidiferrum sp.]
MMRKMSGLLALSLLLTTIALAQTSQPPTTPPQQSVKTVAERLGYPANSRLLVIHADDFGMLHSVNTATIEALNNHWITSASILVPCPWFPEVARTAREHPEWDLGIHLALTSEWTTVRWRPLAFPNSGSSLTDKDGYLPATSDQVIQKAQLPDIDREMRAQIDTALASGVHLTHFDSHMWAVGRAAPSVYVKLGRSYGLPVLMDHGVLQPDADPAAVLIDRILGLEPGFSADQWLNAYENILRPLPPGTYQLIVHLAYADDEMQAATFDHADWGAQWRQNDFDLVKNPAFQRFLKDQGFTLVSWRDLAKALPPTWKSSAN